MKFTKKVVNAIINHYLQHRDFWNCENDRIVWEIGYYQKANTNWSYHIGFNADGLLMVECFGQPVLTNI